jgi:hypothetical protein
MANIATLGVSRPVRPLGHRTKVGGLLNNRCGQIRPPTRVNAIDASALLDYSEWTVFRQGATR